MFGYKNYSPIAINVLFNIQVPVRVKQEADSPDASRQTHPAAPPTPALPSLPEAYVESAAAALPGLPIKQEPKSPPKKKSALSLLFDDIEVTHYEPPKALSPLQRATAEVDQYRREAATDVDSNTLDFWKEAQLFPLLSMRAQMSLP